MHTITPDAIIVGVDTHKDVHVAVAVTGLGARLGAISTPATATGYRQLARWAHAQGNILAFGIESTGSYGAGLSRTLTAQGCRVIEVNRPNRQFRRQRGKSDTIDAEAAARAVLAGEATTPPKSGNGDVEMIRHLKIARDTALKARTQAMVTLKTLLVNAPQPLRERFIAITGPIILVRALAALRLATRAVNRDAKHLGRMIAKIEREVCSGRDADHATTKARQANIGLSPITMRPSRANSNRADPPGSP